MDALPIVETTIKKAPVTLCIIVHNAGEKLRKVVEHHKAYVSEVVVCDQGSTDNTLEIANEVADIVVKRRCKGYSDPDRNWAFSIGSQPYVLAMDDDEFLQQDALEALNDLTSSGIDAVWFKRENLVDGISITEAFGDDPQCRLWKRGMLQWPAKMHTFPSIAGPNCLVLFSDLWMDHIRSFEQIKRSNGSRDSVAPPDIQQLQATFVSRVEKFLEGKRSAGYGN